MHSIIVHFFMFVRIETDIYVLNQYMINTMMYEKFGFLVGTVRMLMHAKIRDAYVHPQFITDVMKPLKIDAIFDQEVQNLSGGELQRVALTLCLGKVSFIVSFRTEYSSHFP